MKRSSRADEPGAIRLPARLFAVVFLGALILTLAPSSAQMVHLPQALTPPEIEGPTYAGHVVATLEEEIAHFDHIARGATDTQRIVIRASLNWRIIAAELIAQGEAAGSAGSVSALIGLRLAHGRGEVDAMLTALHREFDRKHRRGLDDIAGEAAALDAISRFNDAAVDLAPGIRTVDVAALDAALPEIFAPLADGLGGWADEQPVSHWPSRREVDANGPAEPGADTPGDHAPDSATLDELRARIAASSFDASIRRPLERALAALEDAPAVDDGVRCLERLIDRMTAFRELEKDDLPRPLRPVRVRLDSTYRQAERAVLERLASFIADPEARSDPRFAALLAGHERGLADLKRLHRMPAWLGAISRLEPEAAVAFENRMKRMSRRLVDANRREATARTLGVFARELAMFDPLPFEGELAAADPAAITAAGGLHEELVEVIRETRRQWASDWSLEQEDGEASQRLNLLHRLTRTMADSAELIRQDVRAGIVNRWAAWDLPPGLLKRSMLDLPNRLKLATAAAVRRDDEALADELDRIDREAPLTRLVGRLSLTLGPALRPLPGAAIGVLGQVVHSPAEDAWMVEHRRDLAELCRYAAEAHRAWFDEREKDARALQEYVNAKAEEMMGVMSQ
ncbi:MAG: hypothetical protein SYC29_13790 [Planctomycetota bacterium]|nr:hypothetical protein [Planctomycetota bacterium]